MENKRIVILNTGGTLSSVMKENGLAPGLRTSDIQKEIRMVSRGIDLETQDLCSLDSANIFPEDWTNLAGKVAELRRECDGIVIIHGTDTMAYTSSMLSFMLRNIDIPVAHGIAAFHGEPGRGRDGKSALRRPYGGQRRARRVCRFQPESDARVPDLKGALALLRRV